MNIYTLPQTTLKSYYGKVLLLTMFVFASTMVCFAQEKATKKALFGTSVSTTQIPSFQGFSANSFTSNTKPSLGKPELDAQLAAIHNATSMRWLIDSLNRDNMEKSKASARIIMDGKVIEFAKLDSIIQQKKRNQSAL